MPNLAGHKLCEFDESFLLQYAHRLGRKSCRLVPVAKADLVEGAEICIDARWFEIFMVDFINNRYFLEEGLPSGN